MDFFTQGENSLTVGNTKSNKIQSSIRLGSAFRSSDKKKTQQYVHTRSQSIRFRQIPHVYYPSALDDSDSPHSPETIRRHSSPPKSKRESKSRPKSYFKIELPKQTVENYMQNDNPSLKQNFFQVCHTDRSDYDTSRSSYRPLSVVSMSSALNSKLNSPKEKSKHYDILPHEVRTSSVSPLTYFSSKENINFSAKYVKQHKKYPKLWELKCDINPSQLQNRGFVVTQPANPRLVLQKSGDYLYLTKIDHITKSQSNLKPREDLELILEKCKQVDFKLQTQRVLSPNPFNSDLKSLKMKYRMRALAAKSKVTGVTRSKGNVLRISSQNKPENVK